MRFWTNEKSQGRSCICPKNNFQKVIQTKWQSCFAKENEISILLKADEGKEGYI